MNVIFSGALYRQDEAQHALCGDGWKVRHPLLQCDDERDEAPARRISRRTKPVPAVKRCKRCQDRWARNGGLCRGCEKATT